MEGRLSFTEPPIVLRSMRRVLFWLRVNQNAGRMAWILSAPSFGLATLSCSRDRLNAAFRSCSLFFGDFLTDRASRVALDLVELATGNRRLFRSSQIDSARC